MDSRAGGATRTPIPAGPARPVRDGGLPVLSAGPTPHTPLDEWTFSIVGRRRADDLDLGGVPGAADRDGHASTSTASPAGRSSTRSGRACRVDTLLEAVEHDGRVRARLLRRRLHDEPAARGRHRRQGLGRLRLRRRATRPRARRPGAAARPAPLLLEERQVGARARRCATRTSRASGRPTATTCTETHGGNSGTRATDLAGRRPWTRSSTRRRGSGRIVLDVPEWPGHRAGQHLDVRLTAEDGYQAEREYSIASAPGRAAWRSPSSGSTTARSRRT